MDAVTAENHDLIVEFVDEAIESLHGLPEQLEAYRTDRGQADAINGVFRAVHSVKGCAAFMGLLDVKVYAHGLENTLDGVRNDEVRLDEALQRALVEGLDCLEAMLHAAGEGQDLTPLKEQSDTLLARVEQCAASNRKSQTPEDHLLDDLQHIAREISDLGLPGGEDLSGRLRQMVTTYLDASDDQDSDAGPGPAGPESLIGAECRLGAADVSAEVAAVVGLFTACREGRFDDAVAKQFYDDAARLADAARSADDQPLADALEATADDLRTVHESPLDVDEGIQAILWDRIGPELERLVVAPPEPEVETDSASDETTDDGALPDTSEPSAAGPMTPDTAATAERRPRFLRVKEDRVEEFLEQVSRLFITVELFKGLHTRMAATGSLSALVDEMREINRELQIQSTSLQQGVVQLRLVAVSGAMSKLPRMARTLASQLGKQLDVHLSGEETEIDKSLAEDLDAPLNHLVRNVVDHAIESPDEREAVGKPAAGNLWVTAEQTRNLIRITIRDDGRGIDPERMRRKALEKGLISQAEADRLGDDEAYQLIFRPGFSTAEQVSDVSGRGVGMDVVRSTLAEHGGQVRVESQLGQGTTVYLEIPVKKAVLVIDGLVIEHAEQQFIVPFDHVQEITTLRPDELKDVHGRKMAVIRESSYVTASLSEILGLPETDVLDRDESDALVLECKEGSLCLLVDRVVGHRQAVVNSIKDIIDTTPKISGVAPTGGGRLALVLHVPELVQIG